MKQGDEKKAIQRKRNPNFLNSILMITLVLVLLGLVGMILLNAQIVSKTLRESIRISVFLRDDLNEVEMLQLRKKIEAEPFVRSTEYLSKEDALNIFKKRYNEDPGEILGEYNPFPSSYEIGLLPAYVNTDSIKAISKRLEEYRETKYVKSRDVVVARLNEEIKTLGIILVVVSALVLLIAATLIDKTIRLAMYSNRFIIRSMQLVGATRWFIMAPYIRKGIINGLIAGLLAVAILCGLLIFSERALGSAGFQEEYLKFAGLFIAVLLLGLLISWWSTHRSVGKYLRMKLDELY
ncbi:MAG: cell division protein FtsX [Bacteroidetes bacterium]|nr:cell division protein FtsX [Bacteroidota bacterium]